MDGDSVEYQATLQAHTKGVNVVRFNGESLASGGDDGVIYVWKRNHGMSGGPQFGEDVEDPQSWSVDKSLRGHLADVYDIEWSSDGKYMVSGSIDNKVLVWDVHRGTVLQTIESHEKFVQGVAFDPLGSFIASTSCDRTCRIYQSATKKQLKKRPSEVFTQTTTLKRHEGDTPGLDARISFIDDNVLTYFRRLTWSPNGEFLVLPSAKINQGFQTTHGIVVYLRNSFEDPHMVMFGLEHPSVAVSFNPHYFQSIEGTNNRRMVFAVATTHQVVLYDTEQDVPIGVCMELHYSQITDLAWSPSGNTLVVSSTDGYCSIIYFDDGELGTVIPMATLIEAEGMDIDVPPPAIMHMDVDDEKPCVPTVVDMLAHVPCKIRSSPIKHTPTPSKSKKTPSISDMLAKHASKTDSADTVIDLCGTDAPVTPVPMRRIAPQLDNGPFSLSFQGDTPNRRLMTTPQLGAPDSEVPETPPLTDLQASTPKRRIVPIPETPPLPEKTAVKCTPTRKITPTIVEVPSCNVFTPTRRIVPQSVSVNSEESPEQSMRKSTVSTPSRRIVPTAVVNTSGAAECVASGVPRNTPRKITPVLIDQ